MLKAGKTLSERKWRSAFTPEGHLDIARRLYRIQRGLYWSIFLAIIFVDKVQVILSTSLGVININLKIGEPVLNENSKILWMYVLTVLLVHLLKWTNFKMLFIQLIFMIGLDVVRTDRTLVFYEKQEHLLKLWDILAVYAWIDKDVGYCQGVSDLCSPMIIFLEDEADGFWCFERLMRRLVLTFTFINSNLSCLYSILLFVYLVI
ncbi:hypothetical protein AQUCO_09000010v1 [Aquilegia coerulea]|uniref:Rab-GAP TBC domain-containing protein n=1 Tax=Aquilegia coerulea TaxID=218851 RepID=A0A2G5C625_AQUCA|nr:hypothetical protein AQUCO_09000010v1 [Aquilegia coerulea]